MRRTRSVWLVMGLLNLLLFPVDAFVVHPTTSITGPHFPAAFTPLLTRSSSRQASTQLQAHSWLMTTGSWIRGGGGKAAAAVVASSGEAGEIADNVSSAYDWCVNLGAPSALVAGAVIATMYEYIGSGALEDDDEEEEDSDSKTTNQSPRISNKTLWWIRFGRRLTRVLLLSAFALEMISIFVTTVTGTMLLSRTLDAMDEIVPVTASTTPLQYLKENFELEYLTSRITFLQGLFNWMAAIALGHIVPQRGADKESSKRNHQDARYMDQFIGGSLITSIIVMLAFYNNHMTFYRNYGHMMFRWLALLVQRFIFGHDRRYLLYFRPLAFFYVPSVIATTYFGIKAFFDQHHDHNHEKE